jgi:hypothetical protein
MLVVNGQGGAARNIHLTLHVPGWLRQVTILRGDTGELTAAPGSGSEIEGGGWGGATRLRYLDPNT